MVDEIRNFLSFAYSLLFFQKNILNSEKQKTEKKLL
jgi:hypothetical protein